LTISERILSVEMAEVFKHAFRQKLVDQADTSLIFYDLDHITARIHEIISVFPDSALHTAAAKANPLINMLKHVKRLEVGVEVASLPELYLAEKTGFRSEKIVFDSPAKTIDELKYALSLGVHINIDSLQELDRLAGLKEKIKSTSAIGLRINPQVGVGKIAVTSVAGEYSKFGIPLKENYDRLIEKYLRYDWLTGIHLHIGSQGCDLDMLVEGIDRVYKLVNDINAQLMKQSQVRAIKIFDIGGGLPVSYSENQPSPTMAEYAGAIRSRCPDLFSGKFRLITEFGRYIYANSGWVVSRVEYVKPAANIKTAIIHVGADLLLRECYNPEYWHHDISVIDSRGKVKSGDLEPYTIAGPLCFAGDIIAREIQLPSIDPGDYILIHDTGAYTLSMWSRYNSRQIPRVIGYYGQGDNFEILKSRESLDDIAKFWC